MKWKYLLVAGAFVGVFSLGVLLAPVDKLSAKNTVLDPVKKVGVTQTANQNVAPQEENGEYVCPVSGMVMGSGAGMGQYFAGSMQEVIADALGMTVSELQAERLQGKSVADLAAEKGVNLDELKELVIEARKAELEQLVKDGVITQVQMDYMLANMESMIDASLQRDTTGPMMNGQGNRMGKGQGGRWNSNVDNQQLPQPGQGGGMRWVN